MTIKTAVGAADDEDRESDPLGTVREETDQDGYFATWVKVGRALVEGYGVREHVWVNHEWLCIHSSDVKGHGKQVSEQHVLGFPIVGAVPNTPAHTQRQIAAARKYVKSYDYAGVAGLLRKAHHAPARTIMPSLRDKRRRREES